VQLYEILTKLLNKEAKPEDIDRLEALCHMVKETSLCGLGQSAPNPVLSTLRYFKDEYLELVKSE
jgi:bidirectional [NiFe] hydrogenase diaphorase subunit